MDVNGYSMKGVKSFHTPDGGGYNASIYYEGKRICEVHEAGMGAPPYVEWFISKNMDKCREIRDKHDLILDEWFIGELNEVFEDERDFKKMIKKHPDGCIVKIEPENRYPQIYTYFNVKSVSDERIKDDMYKEFPKETVKSLHIYRTLDDFIKNYPDLPMLSDRIKKFYDKCATDNKLADQIKIVEAEEIERHISEPEFRKKLLENIRENKEVMIGKRDYSVYSDAIDAERYLSMFEQNLERSSRQTEGVMLNERDIERGSHQRESDEPETGGTTARPDESSQSNDEREL